MEVKVLKINAHRKIPWCWYYIKMCYFADSSELSVRDMPWYWPSYWVPGYDMVFILSFQATNYTIGF